MKKIILNDNEKEELEQKENIEKDDSINTSYKYIKKVIHYI